LPPQKNSQKLHCRIHRKAELSSVSIARIFSRRLLTWFEHNDRHLPWRNETNPYKILVTEKLLQQTDVGHVLKAYEPFFVRFPNLKTLSEANVEEIERAIRPLGFWRQRARQLKRMSIILVREHGARVPMSKEELLKLPGVGRYIANSFLSFGARRKAFAVDVNVRRVAHRLLYWADQMPKDDELESVFKGIVPPSKSRFLNWAVFDFAASVCRKSPRCGVCFARDLCKYYLLSGGIKCTGANEASLQIRV